LRACESPGHIEFEIILVLLAGSYVTHETKHFIYFYLGERTLALQLLWYGRGGAYWGYSSSSVGHVSMAYNFSLWWKGRGREGGGGGGGSVV